MASPRCDQEAYVNAVAGYAMHFGSSPADLGPLVWQATEMISSTEVAKRDSMTFPIVALQGVREQGPMLSRLRRLHCLLSGINERRAFDQRVFGKNACQAASGKCQGRSLSK